MDASQTPTPDERLSTHHGLVSVANQLPMGENHWPDRIAMPVDIRDALVADLIDARGELEQLRTQHAGLLAVVQTIHEITADTDPEDYEQWPGGPDEFRSAIWSRCVAALAAAAKGAGE